MSTPDTKRRMKSSRVLYFFAAAAITTVAFIYLVKEGQRIKVENELLSYEVW